MRLEEEEIEDIAYYMMGQAQINPYIPNQSRNNDGSNDQQSQGRTQGCGRAHCLNRRNNNNNNNQNNANNQSHQGNNNSNNNHQGHGHQQQQVQNRRIQRSDPCPLPGHFGHTWGECHQNQYGDATQQGQPQDQQRYNLHSGNRN